MLKMYKSLFVILLSSLLSVMFCFCAFSQENQSMLSQTKVNKEDLKKMKAVTFILKTNILPIIYGPIPYTGEYRLAGEFLVGKKSSITASAAYLGKGLLYMATENAARSQNNNGGQKITINGFRIQGGYKYYLYNKPYTLKGVFVSPNVSYGSAKYYYKSNPADFLKMTKFQTNLYIGGQVAIANRYCLELFLGPGFKINRAYETDNNSIISIDTQDMGILYNTNFSLVFGFNFGIAL